MRPQPRQCSDQRPHGSWALACIGNEDARAARPDAARQSNPGSAERVAVLLYYDGDRTRAS